MGDLEAAGRLNAIAFDKTGTLTTGQLAVTRLATCAGVSPEDALRVRLDGIIADFKRRENGAEDRRGARSA